MRITINNNPTRILHTYAIACINISDNFSVYVSCRLMRESNLKKRINLLRGTRAARLSLSLPVFCRVFLDASLRFHAVQNENIPSRIFLFLVNIPTLPTVRISFRSKFDKNVHEYRKAQSHWCL